MSALRAKQEKMAEFLIYRGVDVAYEVDLIVSYTHNLVYNQLKNFKRKIFSMFFLFSTN